MLSFAGLQWNDPDAITWVVIYLSCAFLAVIAYKNICTPCTVTWAILTACLSIYLFLGVFDGTHHFLTSSVYSDIFSSMQDDKPQIEEMREALGLGIVWIYILITLLALFITNKKVK